MENAATRTFRNRDRVLTVGQLFDRVDSGLELRATVARLEEQISIERRKKRDRDAVHFDRASDADDRDAYHHDWAAFRKQAAEDAYQKLPVLLATIKALLEDRERVVALETALNAALAALGRSHSWDEPEVAEAIAILSGASPAV